MRNSVLLLLALVVSVVSGACGRPTVERAGPLGPELYEIDADDVPPSGAFIRYASPGPRGGGLDVAVTEYADAAGQRAPVRLVGVVHIADPPYYREVQAVLDACEVVLYEAIKPADLTVSDWTKRETAPGGMPGFQKELASWFGFQFQLEGIDYAHPRFVHADMTLEQFMEAGGAEILADLSLERGEGPGALPPRLHAILEQVRAFGRDVLSKPNPLSSMARKMLAKALGTMDLAHTLDMFPALPDLVLRQRNVVAMERLQETLPTARGPVAIFYGAAHMEDLESRLLKLGYRRTGARWLRAWALRAPLSD